MAAIQSNYDFPNTNQYGISNHFYIDSGSSSTSLSSIVAAAFSNTMIAGAVGKGNRYNDVGQLCQGKYGSDSGCNQIIAWYEGGPQTYGTVVIILRHLRLMLDGPVRALKCRLCCRCLRCRMWPKPAILLTPLC